MEILVVALINTLCFWRRDNTILWFLCCVVDTMFGYYWASTGTVGDHIWVEGIVIVVIGGYCLFTVMFKFWKEIWGKSGRLWRK